MYSKQSKPLRNCVIYKFYCLCFDVKVFLITKWRVIRVADVQGRVLT